ncbi:MAG: M28 family peptidase [Candidatus Cloacimonetes bacterium]|nr:M28 family peptidase [Candidatus Cloacimonadota bacterium]
MKKIVISILSCIVLFACQDKIPQFNQQRAFSFLEKQCEIGPRYPGSEGIILCREYLISVCSSLGAVIEQQAFEEEIDGQIYQGVNIMARFHPQMSRRILFGAHYDTRPWADKDPDPEAHTQPIIGANDAASGVAVLLELASVIHQKEPVEYGIDFVFFDLEDMGTYSINESWCLGSQAFVKSNPDYKAEKVIIVDMVGDADLEIQMEYFSYHNSPLLVKEIWDSARDLGYTEFQYRIGNVIYDDHYAFIAAGYDATVIIDFDYPYWHTMADTPDKCSPISLNRVGQTLLNIIYSGDK